jgi:DNA polymerase I-like protein with 3'-5' exonuclease and polymerase domains
MRITLGNFSCPFTPWRPEHGRLFDRFSFDTETTDIDEDRPELPPAFVLGAACDGRRGVFLTRDTVKPFFAAHPQASVILHHAAFDLKVTAPLLHPEIDLYQAVDANRVWDTMILKRLHSLATVGHTARGECSLADCAQEFLGVTLKKEQTDAHGQKVRTGFGQFLGKPPSTIPGAYLAYLGQDALATWHLFGRLHQRIRDVLRNSTHVWGYVNDAPDRAWGGFSDRWLREVIDRFGPLTHHVQLRASIVMDALSAHGIGVDRAHREEKERQVRAVRDACKERLRQRGFLVGEKGCAKALQSILSEFHRDNPDVPLKRTASGEQWATGEEDLADLAAHDPFFRDYADYRHAEKLLSTYLAKMGPARLHPRFGYLVATGRTSCSGFNLQNLPSEKRLRKEDNAAATLRGCFVPAPGHVFIDSDYGQIELVVLAHAWARQFGLTPRLAPLINADNDIHRLLAAAVLGKDPAAVTKEERNSAKPVSFGRPGGMAENGLRRVARFSYGIDLTDAEVTQRIGAYHRLCPELDAFLQDEVDPGAVLAAALHLTPAQYCEAVGKYHDPLAPENAAPAGWLGGMLLKVLRDPQPVTDKGQGRPYSPEEITFFWERAQHPPVPLKPAVAARLRGRQADVRLWDAVHDWAGRRPVFTLTGRLRARATFGSARNTIFQGAAADGAVLGLWRVWRAGYKLVSFVHDQLVVESPADDRVKDRVADIERLMKEGMAEVVPGMRVKVETVVTRSLNKDDRDPRYDPGTRELRREAARAAG